MAGIGDAWNSTRFLARMREPGRRLAEQTLIVIDEGSTMSMTHLAEIVARAERDNAKVLITGDHQQLAAVEAGGGMSLLAHHLGHTQLAVPVRFTAEWEQQASLRLREGDKSALEAYDEPGRITGGTAEQVFEDARRGYVAARLAGEQVLLMAYTREDCRELSRIIRDDLVHLGLVDGGRSVMLAAGARASAGDLIVARENDHQLVTDPGHPLANGTGSSSKRSPARGCWCAGSWTMSSSPGGRCCTRRASSPPPTSGTRLPGMPGWAAPWPAARRCSAAEPREWAYVALTRGRERNTARVITQAQAADPSPGTQADPELARADLLRHERAGLPADPAAAEPDGREAVAVLADCLDRAAGEDAATEYQRTSLARADHLGLLHTRWADQVKTADRDRYQRIVQDALPEQWRGPLSPQATWLYRTLQAAELAGLDAAEVTQTAIRSRSLDGARDVASVLDARLRAMTDPLVPLPLSRWSQRVPRVADPDRQEYVRRLAKAMDERTDRIGEHAVQAQPPWAVRALGPVPDEPGQRLDWQQRASAIGAYRELYGIDDERDPLGPEPAGSSPEQRAAWHAGFAALTRTDTVDVRALPEASLWQMRDSYKAETEWAPPHVGKQLRAIRFAAEDNRLRGIQSRAEARAATDPGTAGRHTRLAASAEALQEAYARIEARLEEAMEDRRAWEQLTAGPRRLAVAADSELRRRHPGTRIEPLRSAEPPAPDHGQLTIAQPQARTAETPEWVTQLAGQRRVFQEKLERRQHVMVPDEDPDYGFLGEAWPVWGAQRDAILQPPKPDLQPCAGIERLAGYERHEPEAGV